MPVSVSPASALLHHKAKITSSLANLFTSTGFFMLWMGFLCTIYAVCALRTNLVFVGIFVTLVPAFCLLAAAYWHLAMGNTATATNLQVAAGAMTFLSDLLGWWIFAAIMLAALDFPFQLPGKSHISLEAPSRGVQLLTFAVVGDLSRFMKSATEKQKEKEQYSA